MVQHDLLYESCHGLVDIGVFFCRGYKPGENVIGFAKFGDVNGDLVEANVAFVC